jgi:predicted type IV restriction endonuclease
MAKLSAKAEDRIKSTLKRFQPIIQAAKLRDINESDTVTIVVDLLEQLFGYDKYNEISSEHSIRGTFCDLAVKLDGRLAFLIEVKAVGLDLKDSHVKQAIDYAANQGVEWVGLTNGEIWRIYKVTFGKPINSEVVVEFNLLSMSVKDQSKIEILGMLAKEGWKKAEIEQFHSIQQIMNRFTIGRILMSEPVVSTIRRELRRLSSDVKVSENDILFMLQNEVIKREILEGDKAAQANKMVVRSEKKNQKKAETMQSSQQSAANDVLDEEKAGDGNA